MMYTVIGASGFVGRRLVASLRADGREVYTPERGDSNLLSQNLGRVFYCAGLTADYLVRPFDTVEAHVGLLSRLLRDARFERLVYLSSTRLYDSLGLSDGREDMVLALDPGNPRHLYDLSKALGENLCLTVMPDRTCVARLSCVFDWEEGASGFLSELLQRAVHERSFSIDSSTGSVRDYIHLDDVIIALRRMIDAPACGIVNVASGENVSNAELIEVFNNCGWSLSLGKETARQVVPTCNVQRLRALGVRPRPARQVLLQHLSGAHANGIA